jgi:hypothetical protein
VNGNNQILKRFILVFSAIALGIYIIIAVQSGCLLDIDLPDNSVQKPLIKSTNDQVEDSRVQAVSPLQHQEPNETPILTEQANQAEQLPEKTDAIVSLLVGLRYIGVDIVIDAEQGPIILEANARPGLSIQLANRRGLWPGLQLIDKRTKLRFKYQKDSKYLLD